MAKPTINVVGGGLAGLKAVIIAAEAGHPVNLLSIVPVKRSHSVCAQGGINAAKNLKGEGDSAWVHFDDSIYGGDFLANQPMVKEMCEAAPGIIDLLDRMGVMFNRTAEGLLDFRRFGGTKHHRTAFAGATTGQQLLYALDEQVRRWESEGLATKYENWDMLDVILDDSGVCRGCVGMNLNSHEVRAFPADATILATGGPGMIYGGASTNSVINTGSAVGAAYRRGCWYANGEFIQVHPTAIPGDDKLRLMSESARGEGGRVWTYKDGKPWYFLEEWYPAYGNLVPRDIATRAIYKVCVEMGLGVDGKNLVYLDLSHLDAKFLDARLGGILEIYEKFVGDDPRKVPMKIFPAVHYSMGGAYIDSHQTTNIPGLLAAGECEYQYHGANRLGANSLLSCIFGGRRAAWRAAEYLSGLQKSQAVPSSVFESAVKREEEINAGLLGASGNENPFKLWEEMGAAMTNNALVVRHNKNLKLADEKLIELRERFSDVRLPEKGKWANQSLSFTRRLDVMLDLARVVLVGALLRNESRGAHYKPDFPDRNDADFLKTTIARYRPQGPEISYEAVDVSLIAPRPRKYDVDKENA